MSQKLLPNFPKTFWCGVCTSSAEAVYCAGLPRIERETEVPVRMSNVPLEAVVLGAGHVIEHTTPLKACSWAHDADDIAGCGCDDDLSTVVSLD